MPTGGGKSLCYQLPALLLPGPTLVVSPLIALMKDQVDALQARGLRATLLNSTLDPSEQRDRLLEIEAGRYDLVYVAPERFRSHRFVETMARVRPALLAVDEAHCISEWGHDFRPDYARIGLARRQVGSPPCIALTATATDLVRRDIADQLDLHDPAQFVTGFDRPNLVYSVIDAHREPEKFAALAETLAATPGSAIVYASSRARCDMVGSFLGTELKRSRVVYHAGLGRDERARAQEQFMSGEVETVVATNAFGMGVDKSDIRAVVHFNLPGTLEAYYQEAGRAGRDGDEAHCVLLYAPNDRRLQEMFIENEYPSQAAIHKVYEFLRALDADPIELTHAEIREAARVDVNDSAVGTVLKILESAGAVERFRPRENMAIVRLNVEPDEPSLFERVPKSASVQQQVIRGVEGLVNRRFGEPVYFHPDDFAARLGLDRPALTRALKALASELPLDYVPPFRGNAVRVLDRSRTAKKLEIDYAALNERKQREYAKLDRMIQYAESRQCRRAYILNYFGDTDTPQCGHCDNCGRGQPRAREAPPRPIDTDSGREVILKALSGVARARGRFGKTMIAQMLIGSSAEKLAKTGLTRLSTFGILASFRQQEVTRLLDALVAAGLAVAEEVEPLRPVLLLSPLGRQLCKQTDLPIPDLALPDELHAKVRYGDSTKPPRTTTADPAETSADPLHAALKALRLGWARELKQSAFTIFTNQMLDEIVLRRPTSARELAEIKGMSANRLEKFGAGILDAIAGADTRERTIEPQAPLYPDVSTEEWTGRLLARGFALLEVAAIRGIAPEVVVDHATALMKQGNDVAIESLISTDVITSWELCRSNQRPPDPPEPVPGLWRLFLAWRAVGQAPVDGDGS
jgi:ATP-dependent DNA helicase RecQ